jgi:hypothetical protein
LGYRCHVSKTNFVVENRNELRFIFSGEIASKPANPLVDSYKSQTSFRDKLQEYKDIKDLNRAGSSSPEKSKSTKTSSINSTKNLHNEELGEEMIEL